MTGTSVLQVTATDADDPTYGNSARVVYSILQGQPYFSVDPKTGKLYFFSHYAFIGYMNNIILGWMIMMIASALSSLFLTYYHNYRTKHYKCILHRHFGQFRNSSFLCPKLFLAIYG